jgi:hypothetical protein
MEVTSGQIILNKEYKQTLKRGFVTIIIQNHRHYIIVLR